MHKALQAEVGSYMRASRGKEARIKDLLGKNEANSKVIENLSTEKADLEDKIKQRKESETKLSTRTGRRCPRARRSTRTARAGTPTSVLLGCKKVCGLYLNFELI